MKRVLKWLGIGLLVLVGIMVVGEFFGLLAYGNPARVLAQQAVAPSAPVSSTLSSTFTYQGYLQKEGVPVDNMACNFKFSLWDAANGGAQSGTQTINGVSVNQGVFTAKLDFGNVFTGDEVWLETAVQCPGDGGYTTLTPRQPITAAPYALSLQPGAVVSSTEPVGLSLIANNAPNQIALYGEANQTGSVAVYGNSADNTAVFGNSGTGRGVWGQSAEAEGVYGYSANNDGVEGVSNGTYGRGVYGQATGTSGWGVYGDSIYGPGVFGESGASFGVRGQAHTPNWAGVYGHNTANSGIGVMGQADHVGGVGVYGTSINNTAVYGQTRNGVGVWGTNHGANTGSWAGYFDGRVTVGGNLSKAGGSFTIDHPLDPENMYLQHSFVESPDMMNVYNGNITLDETGEARVILPDWFEALNQEFRYQLTAVGAPGPNLYIAETVKDNQFKIAGGSPGMTVSWQVTGIRHDPWADANRIEVELPKNEAEQGLYLHPELYGLPPERGISAQFNAGIPTVDDQIVPIND